MSDFGNLKPETIERAATMMKAIAHPVRLEILGHLADNEEINVTRIHELVHIEQSAASHHLGILKDKGVLLSRRNGKKTFYSLKNKMLEELVDCINKCACFE